MKRFIVFASLLLATVSTFAQQQFPMLERGLNPEKLYQFNGIDTVGLFNGNLTLLLPIGMSYPMDGGMSYQLQLSYNSNIWEFSKTSIGTLAYPVRRSNAGAGWIIGMGAFLPTNNPENNSYADVYQSPDGGEHRFDSPQNIDTLRYTTDGSNLRLRTLTQPASNAWIDFPDGSIHYYVKQSDNTWFLTQITSPRGSKTLTFSKPVSRPTQCGSNTDSWIKIDDLNRAHYLCFDNRKMDGVDKPMIDTVNLQAPQGQRAIYTFTYETVQNVLDPPGAELPMPIPEGWRWQHEVTLLKSIGLPDGSSYGFEHDNTTGWINAMVLPTKGRIEYARTNIPDMPSPCLCTQGYNQTAPWPNFGTGPYAVQTRTVRDVVPSGKTATASTWSYAWNKHWQGVGNFYCKGPGGALNYVDDPVPDELIVSVTDPTGGRVDSHFSIWPADMDTDSSGGFKALYNGFPYGTYDAAQNRWLSQEQYQCGAGGAAPCTKLRSTYVRHDLESRPPLPAFPNAAMPIHRLASQRVFHHDNPVGCTGTTGANPCKSVTSEWTEWDGLGHYRLLTTSHDIGTPGTRSVRTDWNLVNGSQRVITASDRWTPDEYEQVKTQEGSATVVEQACFSGNASGRYLKAKRTLKGITPAANDLLVVFDFDTNGNMTAERYYGGDSTPLPSSAATATNLCSAISGSLGSVAYQINHTWQYGVMATSQYNTVTFKLLDLTIDASGVVTQARDTADVSTTYAYDSSGRITSITPTGSLATVYTYSPASASGGYLTAPATATQTTGTSGQLISYETAYQYDSLGRLWRQKLRMPGGTWSVRETVFDSLSRKASVSEQEQLVVPSGQTELQFTPTNRTTYTYDSFGRTLLVTAPDTSKTRNSYVGTEEVKRYVTDPGLSERWRATELFDGFGQLTSVTERPDTAGDVVTTYGYDAGGHLTTVKMKAPNGVTQNRTFDYDGRGFLRWENHPESGMSSYTYDARGHVLSKDQSAAGSQFDLRYFYDPAERLYRLEGRNPFYNPSDPDQPQFRPIKVFTFGTANGNVVKTEDSYDTTYYDLRKGKLVTATRFNYGRAAWDTLIEVEDRYEYLDTPGRNTHRTTNIYKNGYLSKSVAMSQTYNGLGQPVDIRYPMCEDCGAPASDPDRRYMNRSYDRGRLKTINGYINDISYWPNGVRNVIQHSNGIADTQTVTNMARPSSIQFAEYDRCVRPTFSVQPASKTLPVGGGTTQLSVSVAGNGPFQYEWWATNGNAPVGYAATINVTVTETTDFYVIVSNACGFENSQTAKVTVGGCTLPSTGFIKAVRQPDGSYILRPDPTAQSPRTYVWKRLSDNAQLGTGETLTVTNVTTTTSYSLTITDDCGSATGDVTISIPAVITKTGLQAAWQGGANISVTWPAVSGATGYVVERRAGAEWAWLAETTTNAYVDGTALPNKTYAYRVYSTGNGGSDYSNSDVATTKWLPTVATNDSVTSSQMNVMLDAVNSVRIAAGWPAVTWSNILAATAPLPAPGTMILADHVLSCRARMNEALQTLGVPVQPYTDPDLRGLSPKTAHINQVIWRSE